jgi:hypothetical protein
MTKTLHIPVTILHKQNRSSSPEWYKTHVTIVYKIEEDNIIFGRACCAPEDHFNRKLGRQIATGRLNMPRSQKQVPVCKISLDHHNTLIEHLIQHPPMRWTHVALREKETKTSPD